MSKVWIITGASRGLGRAFTEAVLEAGDRVVATARNPEQLVELQGRYSGKIRTVALDVTNEAQAKAAFEAAIAFFGVLDVLVNNAGYGYVCPVEDTALTDFRAQIETNLFGVIIMTKAVLPYFRERRAGHIIQVTSIAGRIGPAGRAPYAAAKFGVEGFSESLLKEIGPLGIKVTIIEPGGFRTDFAGSSTRGIRRRQRRRFYTSPRSPSRRYGCCSEATLTWQPKRALLIRSSRIGIGRISASQLTIRPTRHPSKNPVNSCSRSESYWYALSRN
jgi:NAD(P)-dependent dehydrogenase (short-subunit alcohol dehydrogenase family)